MSKIQAKLQLLNLISQPAFYWGQEGILCANSSAEALGLIPGTDIVPMLLSGTEHLQGLGEGSLSTALRLGGALRQVSVTAGEGEYLFLVDSPEDGENLQALALAALQLRGPLEEVLGASQVLLPQLAPRSMAEVNQVRDLNRGLMQLLRIVANMSDAVEYAQYGAAQKQPIALGSFIGEIFDKTAQLCEPLGLDISFTFPQREIQVYADTQQLERCVYNLLSNALRFTPRDGFIRGSIRQTASHGVLTIRDSGDGLSDQVRQMLFNRYRRAPALEDSRYGLGLGLLIARLTATAHGGALFIGPGKGGGTEAALSLSLSKPGEDALASPVFRPDYTGLRDHGVVELSRELPRKAMDYL